MDNQTQVCADHTKCNFNTQEVKILSLEDNTTVIFQKKNSTGRSDNQSSAFI